MTAPIEIELRKADDDDLPFLLALRHQTMTEHEAAAGKVRSSAEVHARVSPRSRWHGSCCFKAFPLE